MPIELIEYDKTEYIEYKKWIMLTNGICGKQIIIDNIETNYIITPDANVFNIYTEYKLKAFINNHGYYSVNIQLGKRGSYKTRRIHQLLGLAYIPNPEHKPAINHIDGNKLNLKLTNLEWVTIAENNKHARKTGLVVPHTLDPEKSFFTQHSIQEVRFVCDLLQSGMSPKKISRTYNLGYDFIQKIRRGVTWTNVSKDYDFPDVKRYSEIFTPEEQDKMNYYFSEGYSVREVIKLMNFEYNESIRGNVKHQKKRYEKLVKDAQEIEASLNMI